MEEVSLVDREAMKEAARLMRAGGVFEESLGKAVRHKKLTYPDYVRLASLVRDLSKKEGIELEAAMRRLSRSEREQEDEHR